MLARKLTPEEHQDLANHTGQQVAHFLDRMHDRVFGNAPEVNAMPIVQGGMTGLLIYAVQTKQSDAEIKAGLAKMIDEILPQIRFADAHGDQAGVA